MKKGFKIILSSFIFLVLLFGFYNSQIKINTYKNLVYEGEDPVGEEYLDGDDEDEDLDEDDEDFLDEDDEDFLDEDDEFLDEEELLEYLEGFEDEDDVSSDEQERNPGTADFPIIVVSFIAILSIVFLLFKKNEVFN